MSTAAERVSLEEASQYAGSPTSWTPENAPNVGLDPSKGFISPPVQSTQPAAPQGPIAELLARHQREAAWTPADAGAKPAGDQTWSPAGAGAKPIDQTAASQPTEKSWTPADAGAKPVTTEAQPQPQPQPQAQAQPQQQPQPQPQAPLPEGPVSLEQEDPQTRINNLIASGKSPGEAQAIVSGQKPKTISGAAPKPKPEPQAPDIGTLAGEQAYVTGEPVSGIPPTEAKKEPQQPITPVDTLAADAKNRVDPVTLYRYLLGKFANSGLVGYVPPDGARWGIKTGSAAEWAAFGLAVAKQESDLNARSTNLADVGGSYGLFQFSQKTQPQFTNGEDQYNPQKSADAFVRSVQHYLANKGSVANLGETFGSIKRPNEAGQYIAGAQKVAAGGKGEDLVSSGGGGGGGAPTLGGGPMVSVGYAGPSGSAQAEQQQSPVYTEGGRGGGGGATEGAPGAGEFSISYPSSLGGVVVVGRGRSQARRLAAPTAEEEEEEDPMVTALLARGFTRAQALKFALSSRALISAKGVGPLQGQAPPAPTPLLTAKPLALPPPAPSAPTATGISVKPSPKVTPPSKQPQIPARNVPPTPTATSADKQAVVQALTGMGINKAHAQQLAANAQGTSLDELLRNALKAHGQSETGVESGSFRPPQKTPPPAPTPKPQQQQTTAPIVAPVLHKAPVPEPEPRPAEEPTPYPTPGGTHGVANPPSFAKLTPGLKLPQAVKEHAALLSPDDPRVKKQADGMIKGEHFVPGDPIHDQLLNGLPEGQTGPQRQILGEAEQAIAEKRPMHISYLSAPKEAQRYPTRESRMVQYDEHSPEARLMGTTVGQMVGHSFIPTAVGIKLPSKAGEPHQSYIQGISTNILANNFQHLNEKLISLGVGTPYKSLGHKFFNDLEGYYSNLNAGHTGTGRGYAVGTEDYPNEPDTSHVPYKLTHKEADFIGTIINNTAAFAKHEDGQKLRDLARANGTLITDEGETNRMRHNIAQHDPGWRERVLEPSIRTFKTGLIVRHHKDEQYMPETIRPGKEFQDLTRTLQRTSERGRPDVPISVSLHHSFQDNRLINKIERDFSENRIDEPEARRQLEAMGEDPNEYRFQGGSGGLITPYEEDPESITPEEHTQMRDNLRKQWVGGKLNVEDYRRKAAEVPLPSKPSQAVAPKPSAEPKPIPEPEEPETPEETPGTPIATPKTAAPTPKAKPAPEAAPEPTALGEAPKAEAKPEPEPVEPPSPTDVLPPAKEKKAKKAAKSPEQIAAEKEDLVQADLHRKKVTPEQQARRDEVQRKAQAALDENPESDPLSAHHYINGHAQFPDWVGTKEDIGKHFDELNPKLDYAKEAHRQRAADALTHDVLHGLSKNSAASDWYDDTVDKSLNHIGQIAPKILTHKDHEMAFKLATAITSQGQDVFPNFESGYLGYRYWHKTGQMPEDASIFGGGPKAEAMIANFKKINRLWKEHGADGLRKILETPMTMRELRDNYGIDIAGESPDHVMEGAAMLGPKIGSFYNNLNKRFHSTTFDLWATRNLNRIAGKMLKFSPTSLMKDSVGKKGPRPGQLSRLDALLANGMIEGADQKQQKVMRAEAAALRKLKNVTREGVLETAPTIAEWAGREHNRYAKGIGGRSYPPALKSPSTSLAKNMDLNLTDLADAPRGPKQRQQFRDIYQRTQDNLANHGIDMKHANNQAVLWYIEQKLFQLGGSRNRASFDYLDAAHRLVRKVKSGELPAFHQEQSQAA